MIKINSQLDLNLLFELPYWEDAFVREWYLLSPSYIDNQKTIAPDCAPSMFVLICTYDLTYPCIELFFEEVEKISFSCNCDLHPVATFKNNQISFSFSESEISDIQSKYLHYRILDQSSLGWKTRYGNNNIFDSGGFLVSEKI